MWHMGEPEHVTVQCGGKDLLRKKSHINLLEATWLIYKA